MLLYHHNSTKSQLISFRRLIWKISVSTFTVLAFLLCFGVSTGSTQEKEHRDYLIKKVGDLFILGVGANDGVKYYKIYNLYFEKPQKLPLIRIKINTVREFFGTVQVTQLFPEYCTVRVLAQVRVEEPEGTRIVLVSQAPPPLMPQPQFQDLFQEEPKKGKFFTKKKFFGLFATSAVAISTYYLLSNKPKGIIIPGPPQLPLSKIK